MPFVNVGHNDHLRGAERTEMQHASQQDRYGGAPDGVSGSDHWEGVA
jgi:hypothetical protein